MLDQRRVLRRLTLIMPLPVLPPPSTLLRMLFTLGFASIPARIIVTVSRHYCCHNYRHGLQAPSAPPDLPLLNHCPLIDALPTLYRHHHHCHRQNHSRRGSRRVIAQIHQPHFRATRISGSCMRHHIYSPSAPATLVPPPGHLHVLFLSERDDKGAGGGQNAPSDWPFGHASPACVQVRPAA